MRLVQSVRRNWQRWAIGALAGIVVLVVGIPFIYIHFVEGKAPAPLKLTTQSTTTTVVAGTAGASTAANATVGVDGAWKVTSGSRAGYRIKETLFGQSNTAVGRTSAVTGTITISGTSVSNGTFSVDMTKVSSDRSQRDNQFQGRIMDTSTYPTATFTLTDPIQLSTLPANGVQVTEKAVGNLMLHGATRPVSVAVTAQRSGTTIQVSGSIPITFADWKISNPSGGPATTEDHGTLEFLLNFVHS
jgi:polyisoprenoid-binding protein YceI